MKIRSISYAPLVLSLALLGFARPAPAATWYIATNGSDAAGGGTTWTNAFLTITNAVTNSADGDMVIVSNGTYTLAGQIRITKGITLTSLQGRTNTFINGNYPASAN
ncbi:MAG: hypothetical protein HYV35_05220, partial [Lentisphaerae bacterium]|nr:hypothetical protein [Lentisphaerota bacterium]